MADDRLKLPPERDFGFYQRRKHDKWREVPPPSPPLEVPVADSHAHLHLLPDPAWGLARCAANGVGFVCMVVDPSEDGARPFDELERWRDEAAAFLRVEAGKAPRIPLAEIEAAGEGAYKSGFAPFSPELAEGSGRSGGESFQRTEFLAENRSARAESGLQAEPPQAERARAESESRAEQGRVEPPQVPAAPDVRIAVGVHPHNARIYDEEMEKSLVKRLSDPRVAVLGEIGLDFHYDLSPRDVQRRVFRRQVELAQQAGLPIALHLRGGEDAECDNVHAEALAILREAGALGPRALLHCCTLPPDELVPWIEAGCYIAYGGALTFKNADAVREGARLVPENRLLVETDSPYMTPEPMRGAACTPAHIVFTVAALAELRGHQPGDDRKRFLQQLGQNSHRFAEWRHR